MSLKERLARLEKLYVRDTFCTLCQTVVFRFSDDPDPRPAVCPSCGRRPDELPRGVLRAFVVHRPGG
jgi:hypothetical protein